jgi:hypothetical protein
MAAVFAVIAFAALLAVSHLVQQSGAARARWADSLEVLRQVREDAERTAKAAEKATEVERRRTAQLTKRIATLEQRRVPARILTDTLTVAPECDSVVQPLLGQLVLRDSLLELKDEYLASYDRQLVYAYQKNVAAVTRIAELEHVVKKPKRNPLLPRFGVGGACGAGLQGPDCVVGVTLSWSF